MSKVRAKLVCNKVEDQPTYEQKQVSFSAVMDGSEENKSFAKFTPSANLTMWISYETEAANAFEEGKEYYLDFSAAE
jgi:hypothetical protein